MMSREPGVTPYEAAQCDGCKRQGLLIRWMQEAGVTHQGSTKNRLSAIVAKLQGQPEGRAKPTDCGIQAQ